MPKMIVSIDGVVIKEVQLTKERTTLGRRPYNDIVIDNLAISGEHAAVQMNGNEVYLEDLGSTNGTYVNGKAAKKQVLHDDDLVELGKYKIKYVADASGSSGSSGVPPRPAAAPAPLTNMAPLGGVPAGVSSRPGPLEHINASIKVLSGSAAGREVPLVKIVTTIGKPGVAVAAITRRQRGFVVHHVEGAGNPALNGNPITQEPTPLKNGDVIELAGTQMQFIQT